MTELEIGLPLSLVAIAFSYKLVIDRTVNVPFLIDALLELPIDIIFLASSLIVAFTITTPLFVKEGLFTFTIYILVSVLIVFLRRRSARSFDNNHYFVAASLAILNYTLCITSLVIAISFVIQD